MISNYVTYHASLAAATTHHGRLPNGAAPTTELATCPTPRRTRAAWVCQGRVPWPNRRCWAATTA